MEKELQKLIDRKEIIDKVNEIITNMAIDPIGKE
jgi:hypothetical protein